MVLFCTTSVTLTYLTGESDKIRFTLFSHDKHATLIGDNRDRQLFVKQLH